MLKKITRKDIIKESMVALSYCQCQTILNRFGYDFKIGYNKGINGWNYDLYRIGNFDIITGYNVPYSQYSNKNLKNKLIELENKVRKNKDFTKNDAYKKEFFQIFEIE